MFINFHIAAIRSIVMSTSLSLLLGLGIAISPLSSSIAIADSNDPTNISTTSTSTTQKGYDAPTRSNGVSCVKGLPNSPTVNCGYASFGARLDVPAAATFRRQVSGLPDPWTNSRGQVIKNGYVGQCQGEFRQVYDPTKDPAVAPNHNMSKAANVSYYSTGVWWQEKRYWYADVKRTIVGRVQNPLWDYVAVKKTGTYNLPYAPFTKFTYTWTAMERVKSSPITRTILRYVDNIEGKNYTQTRTLLAGQSANVLRVERNPFWTNRVVTYGGCNFPRSPKLYTNICATSVGPGYMRGPTGNPATTPWPVPTGVGTLDPQTEIKIWNTRPANASSNPYWKELSGGRGILYSDLGLALENDSVFRNIAGLGLPPENPSQMAFIENCPDVAYNVSARDQSCIYMGSTFPQDYGRLFPAGSEYCKAFTPGNYYKYADGKTSTCQYAEVWWDPTPGTETGQIGRRTSQLTSYMKYPQGKAVYKKVFLGCDLPQDNPSAKYRGYAHWVCNDPRGANGENMTYNFANCSGPRPDGRVDVADEYRCVAANNGNPAIIDVESGSRTGSISQMLANGKQIQVRWPEPTGISVLSGGVLSRVQQPENMWQNWEVVAGSEPINDNLGISDRNQSIFGHYRENQDPGSSTSVLGGPGKDEWDTPWIYLRGYKAAPVNTTGSNLTVGTQTIAPDETIPLGLTTTFNATVQRTVTTGLGGSLEINVPVICKMPDAYLYVVSGRATD